ncbi:MAG: sensor histidine kinase [Candidatus Helarchaeota archaeon]
MLDEQSLALILVIYSVLAGIIGLYTGKEMGLFGRWGILFISFSIGAILAYFQWYSDIFYTLGNVFYFIATLSFLIPEIREYRQIRQRKKFSSKNTPVKQNLIVLGLSMNIFIVGIGIEWLLVIIIGIGIWVASRIYCEKRSPTQLFIVFTLISALCTLIVSIETILGMIEGREILYAMHFCVISFIIAACVFAIFEGGLKGSEMKYRYAYEQTEFYKNLFMHDVNNIFQSVASVKDILELTGGKLEQNELLKIISILNEQVLRGINLVKNINKLSQLNEFVAPITSVNVKQVLNKVISFIQNSFREEKLAIQMELEEEHLNVLANALLFDVFENIMLNAIRYNRNVVKEILIKVSRESVAQQEWVKIQFLDNGIGISDDRKAKIFQRQSKRHKEGLGLGLSLVKSILESYNGKIWVENRVMDDFRKGSNFVVCIPAAGGD